MNRQASPYYQFMDLFDRHEATTSASKPAQQAGVEGIVKFLALLEEGGGFARARLLELYRASTSLSLAINSCIVHSMATVTPCRLSTEAEVGGLSLEPVPNGWQSSWYINGVRLPDIVETFLANPQQHRLDLPSCVGANCEESCPNILDFDELEARGSPWRHDMNITIALVVVVGILAGKCLKMTAFSFLCEA